jgi:Cu/Ag efflux protein CusF
MLSRLTRSFVVATVAGLVMTVGLTAHAGEKAKPDKLTFAGEVTAVDATANTVTVKHKSDSMTFNVGADCKIYVKSEKSAVALKELKVGDKVNVLYTNDSGKRNAHRIGEEGAHATKKDKKEE